MSSSGRPPPLDPERARSVLGVTVDADAEALRAAFRRELKASHPDLNPAADAARRTALVTSAYQLLRSQRSGPASADGPVAPATHAARPGPAGPRSDRQVPTDQPQVLLTDDGTVVLAAPRSEALLVLVDAAHRLGEVSYLDPHGGLVEVVVEFQDAPTASVVLSLQGRSNGDTEIMCSVEPLSGGDAPPDDAVTRLLARTLRGEDPST